MGDLAEHFKIEKPAVKFARADSKRSWFYHKTNEIHLSKDTADKDSVLHEFAHSLVKANGGKCGHHQYFVVCLIKVADFYYGDPDKYPWRWEYIRVRKMYKEIRKAS